MGVACALANWYGCSRPFTFNPLRVPSITINGSREPICRDCVERANPQRIANGLAPIVPMPGAYEACDESELP
jgi:hypothetical protein